QRPAQTDALHQRRRKWAGQAIEEDADGSGKGNHVAPPAKGLLERQHHHGRRGAQACRDQKAQENDADHHKGIALAKGACRNAGLSRAAVHVTDRYVALWSVDLYVPIGNIVNLIQPCEPTIKLNLPSGPDMRPTVPPTGFWRQQGISSTSRA